MKQELVQLETECELVVDTLLARYDWQLLPRAAFVQQILAHLHEGIAVEVRNATLGVYSKALHEACANSGDEVKQERGYLELGRYLYGLAYHRYRNPSFCEEVSQHALSLIFEHVGSCRKPVAFLAFAAMYLRQAIKRTTREQEILNRLDFHDDSERTITREIADERDEPLHLYIAEEQRVEVKRMLDDARQAHPRAARQLDVVEMRYIRELTEAEISQHLQTPIDNVYVLRTRGIQLLRSDPSFCARSIALGLWIEEAMPIMSSAD